MSVNVAAIRGLRLGESLTVSMPDYKACISAKNLVGYVKFAYPREGETYKTHIDRETFEFTVMVISKNEEV